MELKKIIPILKIGATKNEYPHYGKYVSFTGTHAQTFNNEISVVVKFPSDLEGATNLYVLDTIINSIKDLDMKQEGSNLLISGNNFESNLVIEDIGFPTIEETNAWTIKITHDLLSLLKTAIKFTGKGIFSYALLSNDSIVATDQGRVFYHGINVDLGIKEPIPINSKILGVLSDDVSIGMHNGNVVVKNDDVEIVFSVALMQDYPTDKILNFVEESREGIDKLCNVAPLIDAVGKVAPVQFGETISHIKFENSDNNLTISAESIVNGKCQMDINSDIENGFTLAIDSAFMSGLNFDFDVFVDINGLDRLYLKNDNESEIVLLTRR